jgi:hypothetical protein
MRLILALMLAAAGAPAAFAQSADEMPAAIEAFVAEEMDDLPAEERARMAVCLGEALGDLSDAERGLLLAEADFEKGLGAVIGGRPEIEDRIEVCEG